MLILLRKAVFFKDCLFSRYHSAKNLSFRGVELEGLAFSVADLVGRFFVAGVFLWRIK